MRVAPPLEAMKVERSYPYRTLDIETPSATDSHQMSIGARGHARSCKCKHRASYAVWFPAVLAMFASLVGCGTPAETDDGLLTTSNVTVGSPETVDLFPALVGDKIGFIDRTGKMVIDPQYHGARYFSEGLASATFGNENDGFRQGYVDTSGRLVIPADYAVAGNFSQGLASVCAGGAGGKWGFIDKTGAYVIEPKYNSAFDFSEGLAAVETADGWGYIDSTGRFTIEPRFYDAGMFGQGLAPVAEEAVDAPLWPVGNWGFIDRAGNLVIPFQFGQAFEFGDGLAPVVVRAASKGVEEPGWYFVDEAGSIVLGPYTMARGFRDGLALVLTTDSMNAYVDTNGTIVWQSENIYLDTSSTGVSVQP